MTTISPAAPAVRTATSPQRTLPRSALFIASVLALDGLCHAVWATGLTWPASDEHHLSLAVLGFATSFGPGVVLPLAALLWTAAGLVVARGWLGRDHRFGWLWQLATLAVTIGVATRAAFGVVWAVVGFGAMPTVFAWINALAYTPLCMVMAVCGWRLLGAGRAGRRVWGRAVAAVVPALLVCGTLTAAYGFPPKTQPYDPQRALGAVESRYVETPVARFHYLKEGSGTPVVLLSPGASWVNSWLPQLEALKATHTVYVVDLPGQGFTSLKDHDFAFTLDGMTGAVDSFLDAVGVKSAALAGNSWSGGWATAYAQRHPERVSSLMLLAPTVLDEPDPTSWEMLKLPVVGRALTNLTVGSRSMTESAVRALFVHRERAAPELVDGFWAAGTRPDNVRSMYELEAGLDWSVTERALPRTTQPTLVIWGRQDTVVPVAQARELGVRLPQAQVHVLDQCGHALTLDCPDQVDALMTGFLRARQQ
ncbi:alpha/beta fold hydrolase [Luteipulveratus mongoliensis]|uniref:AB hydrolase-1 domain-containing protein n=1 Tax=Luteipulveratus mongoliensis TaxID=571913 RepID=A0A0K1JF28_9MICO|nr:alpha/beta fold hydrolase [Luteipulveratus mongoliensis]AKU15309.1 hypothetical protein VV02_04600 [Luteipulveratus mongoliensis]